MANKKFLGLIVGLAVVMSATFFASCGTAPKATLSSPTVTYDILGPLDGANYASYDEALTAAKAAYPDATGVIELVGNLDNTLGGANGKFIPVNRSFGYYAVKFKTLDSAEKKGLFGIF